MTSERRSALATALTVLLPSREMTWLLRAALRDGTEARESWRRWCGLTGDVKAAMADDSLPVKRLLTVLFASLRRAGADLDPSLVPYLRLAYAREQMRTATYLRILEEVMVALERDAVPAIALRGAALATSLYAEPALRHCHDIDLLIRPEHLERAVSALEWAGLTRSDAEPDSDATGIKLSHSSGLPVELHQRLFDSSFYALPESEAWAHTRTQRAAGISMTVLSPEDMLLHICGHASCSRSRRSLRWVCDAWHVIQHHPGLDWERFAAAAERSRLALPLSVMLRYLADDIGASIPAGGVERLQELAQRAPAIERDVALRAACKDSVQDWAALLRLVPGGWLVKVRLAAWLLFPSPQYVREVLGVRGTARVWARYATRPFRFARRRFQVRTSSTATAVGLAAGLLGWMGCGSSTAPVCSQNCDTRAIVYGRITSTSGVLVPGATAIVRLYSDTLRVNPFVVKCVNGPVLASVSQQLDSTGSYRVALDVRGVPGRRLCVEVTGDPHGLYSDIGLKIQYGGFVQMRDAISGPPDSLRVDVKYTETP